MYRFFLRRSFVYFPTLLISLITVIVFITVRSQASQAEQTDDTVTTRSRNNLEQQSREKRLRELDARLSEPGMLLLRAAEFDPLKNTPAAITMAGASLEMVKPNRAQVEAQAGTSSYLIVQFDDVIKPEQTQDLRARGYEIKAYVPNNAYIVKVPRTQQSRVLANQEKTYRWVGVYGAGLKVQPDLVKVANNSQVEGGQEMIISFTTFSGEKADPIKLALASLSLKNSAQVIERFDGVTSGKVVVTAAELPGLLLALANLEGIEWIERYQRAKPENDNGVKIIQSGPTANDTPLYRNGLTGTGQIIGIADAGLDADHAQFRLSGDASAQTLSYATTTAALTSGELPFNVTNPLNKVLTYYVLGTGRLIDNANNPNGGKVLDPNEQSGGYYLNGVAYDDSNGYHGTHTTSVIAGRDYAATGTGAVLGISTRTVGDGIAPDVHIVFQDVGHPAGDLSGLDVGQGLLHQQAYNTGARIHTDSYGFSAGSPYEEEASAVDQAMWRLRDYTVFFSAGNSGPANQTLTKDSKNALLVGGAGSPTNGGSPENVASFSSHGPTNDGRIKPDIVAPSTVYAATESAGVSSSFRYLTSTTANDAAVNPVSPNNNRSFSSISGTSFASPMAAGGGVLVRQYFADGFYPTGARNVANGFNPSNALIKAMLLNSGRNMTGTYTADNATAGDKASLPSMGQGWGRLTLDDALYFPGDRRELKVLADIWNGATTGDSSRPATNPAIMTGQTHTYQLTNVSNVEPLRISLVWTDPKAAPYASVALINNLNLEVTDPIGKVFRGNVNFQNAYSQAAGNTAFDNKNPLEAVYIQYPSPGTYTIKVIGANVPGNGQMGVLAQPGNQTIDSNRQGYALVATGNFTAPSVAIINLGTTTVSGGVNADKFVSRNETVTAVLNISNPTTVTATNVTAQIAVGANSQVPASLVRINGLSAGQSATMNFGDLIGPNDIARAFQVTLLNSPSIQTGQTITFNITLTPANGAASTTQFALTVAQKIFSYRTRFEPVADSGGQNIVVIPESDWTLRPDNPNPAPTGDSFLGNWQLTTAKKSDLGGSTASIGDPSGVGSGYGFSSTQRTDGVYDESRYWTKKIVLPGLNVANDKVTNPEFTQQLNAAVDSWSVDINSDFAGDIADGSGNRDIAYLRMRTYRNTAAISGTTDTGFNSSTFTNLFLIDSSTPTNGFKRFSDSTVLNNTGSFGIDTTTPDNSDVAFRLELHLRRNSVTQAGDGIFYDNVQLNLRMNDPTVYSAPLANSSTTVSGAGFAGAEVAPGALVSSFGTGFPAGTTINANAQSFPIPTTLNNVSVRVNGVLAPLLYVGVGAQFGAPGAFQINYQLPFETTPGVAFVEVLNNGTAVTSEFLTVRAVAPGIFSFSQDGKGQGAVLNQNSLTNDSSRPETRGRVLQIFATGNGMQLLNSITLQPISLASGSAVPTPLTANDPLYLTAYTPTVTIGGVPAVVEFSGLAPGFVGLWQVNVRIPANAPTGSAVPLVVSVDGRPSNQTTVAIN
ncbi:MAG: S8 family serine peptidase [Acidobacteria bacterium]|nr:S8 family serine peptidase [Acidobacteriota bacterium]